MMDNYCINCNYIIKWLALCLCLYLTSAHNYKGYQPPTQPTTRYLTCHDCAKKGCDQFIQRYPSRAGKCETKLGQGKCFIRKDPNQRIYWGCIDDYFWPDVPWRRYNGCFQDWERSWEHNGVKKPIIWCFCDTDHCNTDIASLNGGGQPSTTTSRPTTPMNGGKEGTEQCYHKHNHVGLGYKSCDHICDVVHGRVHCSCYHGYALQKDGRTCKDIDECHFSNGGCTQSCFNTLGSYYCTCNPGYATGKDGKSCMDVNECQNGNGGCSHTCTNTAGSHVCSCPQGYMLRGDGKTCEDINECKLNQHQCEGACTNTVGSYTCACMPGFTMAQDMKSCIDIDECTTGTHTCSHTCINTYGSYYCECVPGFTLNLDQKTCLDINECALNGQAGCQQLCTNTEGSYYCDCNPGYYLNTDKLTCSDIDECQVANGNCAQVCNNYVGGYACGCNPGYQLVVNSTQCVDQNECLVNNGDCSHKCINTQGSYECRCHDDSLYAMSSDGRTCITICPDDFIPGYQTKSCYKIITPTLQDQQIARDYYEAEQECQKLHKMSHLINIDDKEEKDFIASHLRSQPTLLDSWQGWWTAAKYHDLDGDFVWLNTRKVIDRNDPLWSFKKEPYEDTCLWVMQIPSYDYTWGNYECVTKSGYICEITLPGS